MHVYEDVYVFMGFQGAHFWFLKTKQTKREYVCIYAFYGLASTVFFSNSSK
jgi:hypothetical protein